MRRSGRCRAAGLIRRNGSRRRAAGTGGRGRYLAVRIGRHRSARRLPDAVRIRHHAGGHLGRRTAQPSPAPDEVAAVYQVGLHRLQRETGRGSSPNRESSRPVVQIPLGNDLIHAPTGAVLLQLRWLGLRVARTRSTNSNNRYSHGGSLRILGKIRDPKPVNNCGRRPADRESRTVVVGAQQMLNRPPPPPPPDA